MINEDIAPRHREFNIMDTMIKMMEKYTDHLEDIVAERTSELAAEKAKTDELLYRMLPRLESIFARCIAEKWNKKHTFNALSHVLRSAPTSNHLKRHRAAILDTKRRLEVCTWGSLVYLLTIVI